MLSQSPRQHWNLWPYELPLHNYPGLPEWQPEWQPDWQPEVPLEQPQQSHIYVLRGGPMQMPDDRSIEFERLKRSYSLFGVAVGISLFQWLTISQFLMPSDQFLLPGMICMLVALTILLLLIYCLKLNSNRYIGCIFFWGFIELITVSMVFLMTTRNIVHIFLATIVSVLTFCTCYLLGARLPTSMLPGLRTACISIVTIAGVGFVMLTLQILTHQTIFKSIYFAVLFVSTLPLALFHAQYLHARGFNSPPTEYLLCVLVMYMEFVIFLMPIYYFMWVQN